MSDEQKKEVVNDLIASFKVFDAAVKGAHTDDVKGKDKYQKGNTCSYCGHDGVEMVMGCWECPTCHARRMYPREIIAQKPEPELQSPIMNKLIDDLIAYGGNCNKKIADLKAEVEKLKKELEKVK